MGYKFGVIIDKDDCSFKDYCVGSLLGCSARHCSLPIRMNPFCTAKSIHNCPKLYDVFDLKNGKKLIIYYCDGRRCPNFSSKLFAPKHIKKFGEKYLTPAKVKRLLEGIKAEKEETHENSILEEILELFLNKTEIEEVKRMIGVLEP